MNDVLRPDVVEKLRKAALDGMMKEAKGTSFAEVLSASFTLCAQMVDYVNKHSPSPAARAFNLEQTRNTLLKMLATTADESKVS